MTARCWIAVAAAEHVRRGRAAGFMQVCHGKAAPLRRLAAGDRVAYYSPHTAMQGNDRLQTFTACGLVRASPPYQVDMGGGFQPWRRDVDWFSTSTEASIRPLLDQLACTAGHRNWGYQFRFGILQIDAADMRMIAQAMGLPAE